MATPRVVVIATPPDLSATSATSAMIAAHTTPGVPVLTVAATSLWAALCDLPAAYAGHDVLLVAAGVWVPADWDARLAWAATADGIAAVAPLCDSTPWLAVQAAATSASPAELDRLIYALGQRRVFEIPALPNSCVYLRRSALDDLATLPQDGLLLARALRAAAWLTVGCDHVYVQDHDPQRRAAQQALAEADEIKVCQSSSAPALAPLRYRLNEALTTQAAVPELPRRAVQLHVSHSWGGGLERWVASYCAGDSGRTQLVLRSIGTWGAFGQRIALYAGARTDVPPLRFWDLAVPIRATALVHHEYQAILAEIIAEYGVDVLLVSSLIGHSLDVLATGVPTVLIAHEYYPFCPALYIYFDGVCTQCDGARLAVCQAQNPFNRFFGNVAPDEWLAVRARYAALVRAETVIRVAPSASVVRHMQPLLPELADKPITVIPHGLDFAPLSPPSAPPVRAKLRVVVLGALSIQKGQTLFAAAYPHLTAIVEWYLVGAGEDGKAFQQQPGVTVIAYYKPDELPGLLAEIQPDVGLLLSIWPETFSFTLSELQQLGIPPLATALGSFADRITDGVDGFLCAPQPQALVERLRTLAAERALLAAVRSRLAEFKPRPVADMIADYHALVPVAPLTARRYFARVTMTTPSPVPAPAQVLVIDPQARFKVVVREFWRYVLGKLAGTPRLRAWQRRWLLRLLRLF